MAEAVSLYGTPDGGEADYTPESWRRYKQAFEEADHNKTTALTDAQAKLLIENLMNAYDGLTRKTNKTDLDKTVTEANNILTGCSEDVKKALEAALANAKAVLANPNATQAEINAALSTLKKAVDAAKVPVVGSTFDDGTLQYKVTKSDAVNGTVTVSKQLKQNKKVIIPAAVKNKDGISFKVTAIEKKVFRKNKKLQTLIIGENVANIKASSFFKCTKLKSITFSGATAPKLGAKAFKGIKSSCKITVTKKMIKKNFKKFKRALTKMAGKKISVKQKK